VIVTTITSPAPYSRATSSSPRRTTVASPTIARRPIGSDCGAGWCARNSSAVSTLGTAMNDPARRSVIAIRMLDASRCASLSLSAQIADTATITRGSDSWADGVNRSR